MEPMPADARIFVAGHRGLVGSAVLRRLAAAGFTNVLTATRDQLDLRDQARGQLLVPGQPPRIRLPRRRHRRRHHGQLHPTGRVPLRQHDDPRHGGARQPPATACTKLLYLGSSCIYPRDANQPITEDELLTGALEPTNEPYAVAKIAGIKLCQSYRRQYGCNFISAMPTNLYGPNDNFDLESSHVLPALIAQVPRRASSTGAAEVEIWGTGTRAPGVPARRRPRRRVPLPDGATTRTRSTSTWAPART